jgi:protein ImuB
MLWTCLLLPSLPLDVFARAQTPADAARPFAITTGGHYPRVVAANAAGRAAGIRDGALVSAALALAPDLVLRERDPHAEADAIRALASWATRFTPAVSLAPPDAVLAEIGGSLRLFGGLERLAAHFVRGAHDLGFDVRLAFAPTATAALFFARAGESGIEQRRERGAGTRPARASGTAASQPARAVPRVVADDAFAMRLAPLPLAHLDVDRDVLAMLAAAGIKTFGDACAQPRDALARRAGPDFIATLDRALGWLADPRPPFVPPPRYEGRLELPVAVEDVEALAFALNRLVHELAGWLEGRGLGVIALSLSLAHERHVAVRSGTAATPVRFALNAPARAPAHLVAVLRERLVQGALERLEAEMEQLDAVAERIAAREADPYALADELAARLRA